MKFPRLDSVASAFFAKSLEYIKARILEKQFPEFKLLRYIPVSMDAGPGAETIVQRMFTKLGMAKIIASNAKNLPRVDVQGEEQSVPVRMVGVAFAYTIKEIKSAAMAGIQLALGKANAARRAVEQELNRIAAFGDAKHGLFGLLTLPNVTAGALPNGAWSMASDPVDVIEDLNSLINTPLITSGGVEFIDTVLMPLEAWTVISDLRVSTLNDKSVLQHMKEKYPGVVFDWIVEFADVPFTPSTGALTPTDVIVAFRRDKDKLSFELPEDFTQEAPQLQGLEFEVPCYAQTGGCMSPFPLSINIGEGVLP